ncbi:heat-shock protein Hsp90 [Methylobacterium sp. Leaf399]|uniref:molecular chaperone HtpG n=1 Tax=unclassified Methylobacterium TaxID=2615210 RepID=UPI0006F6141D|nr:MULTISPECIES: molecular chaperone HtpG [unclassified Methylobacterium]KQT08545.1 heat-shock protein Hsp90 [Methylobacterium sp. Leaf399]KQT81884.1 heat-shock protein Hsp90 [Methylobacterium sp. Leaf466]
MNESVERHEFGAEVGRLLDLVVHALYSDREIFLRELVANAADAMDRRRFEALTDSASALPADAKIRIVPDKDGRTLTISDAGLGMSKLDLTQNLGTIARSGTRAFSQSLAQAPAEDKPSLIGQFGVGFYSAFMVADRVSVTSRRVGADEAWTWASEGQGSFTLEASTRSEPGTDIVLHLKADADEYLESYRLDHVVRKWADHITVPIAIVSEGKEEAANQGTALWRKPKSEVSEEQYAEFYRHVGFNFDAPWATLHWRAEGAMEFAALLFVPGMKPFQAVEGERASKVRLHVRRMFITDEAELLPSWLRFVQGVVDTEDLPLNVSREMLQATPVLAKIRRAVTGKVLSELTSRSKDAEGYAGFWENFGPVLKEGIYEDQERRDEIAPLLRFRSSAMEGWTSLTDYVARMKDGQEAIYYLVADDADALANSPQLEGFRARGVEVLLLSDHVDAFWPESLGRFADKPLQSVTKGTIDLAAFAGAEAQESVGSVEGLVAALKQSLGADVSDVRATDRLVESAVVLSASGTGPDLQMQRLLRRAGRGAGGLPVLEINPRHPLIRTLAERIAGGGEVGEAAGTLLDLARIQDGDTPRDPVAFARRVAAALAADR